MTDKHTDGAPALPNPAQLRAMARPCAAPPAPCVPGRHCERYARGLGACVAGYCKPPAPAGREAGTKTESIGMKVEDWACYGLPAAPMTPEQRGEVIDFALGFEECQDSRETLAGLSDKSLVNAAYWAMAEFARGQM